MKIVLTRDEVKDIVGKYMGLDDFILEINSDHKSQPSVETVTTDSNMFVLKREEIKDEGETGPYKSKTKHKRIDFTTYGIIIEEFYNSGKDKVRVNREGLSLDGIAYRYTKAIQMFDYQDRVTLSRYSGKFLYLKRKDA